MNRIFSAILVIIAAGLVSGCASSRISSHAFIQSEQAVSIPHPVEMEKAGERFVTVFSAILSPEVWGVESVNGAGVWPVLAEQKNSTPLVGYAFVTDLNWWGDFLLQIVLIGKKADLVNSKILYLNRDGGWVYDLTGQEFNYDPEKFEKDSTYRGEVFKNGTTLVELENFWKMYSEKRGIDQKLESSREIEVGSSDWDNFKAQLTSRLRENYKMPNGEIRQGYLSLEDFRKEASQNNGTTSGQRFARNAFIPVAIDPISASIGVTSSILNGLMAANNGPIKGFYAQAECLRGDLKPNFKLMQRMYKQLLQQRDAVIYELQKK